uniref:Uncharacterized protein n=1 Tax=Pipistrellus kuhlii TaxID=59472 RepID=A0A7J7YX18_PIPKU|nr:hypothetical protein mPipKuh1_009861 [Pipistrellus kuhlii]
MLGVLPGFQNTKQVVSVVLAGQGRAGQGGVQSRQASAGAGPVPAPGLAAREERVTDEGSAPPCMLRREILVLPGGAGRNPNTGLESAFLGLRGHRWGVHKSRIQPGWRSPPTAKKPREQGGGN